jgi:hypothetical protein
MKTNYKSDIVLGEKYTDTQTGYEGTAILVTFFQHGCERVTLESYDADRKEIKEMTFDSPRLKSVKTGKVAETPRTGGPDKSPANVRRGDARR